MKMKILVGSVAAALLMLGCTDTTAPVAQEEVKPTISEESLGLRTTNLYTEADTVAEKTEYRTAACGTAEKIQRAFDNAPPMVPHDMEGMLPIAAGNNACLSCHMPELAPSIGATAIPKSHFTSFRPVTKIAADGTLVKDGTKVANTSDHLTSQHELKDLNQARFNCSQCHAPQSTGNLLVENNFRPDFQSEGMKTGSNLLETMNMGVE
jgi:cytochrome c-type protein NapB